MKLVRSPFIACLMTGNMEIFSHFKQMTDAYSFLTHNPTSRSVATYDVFCKSIRNLLYKLMTANKGATIFVTLYVSRYIPIASSYIRSVAIRYRRSPLGSQAQVCVNYFNALTSQSRFKAAGGGTHSQK